MASDRVVVNLEILCRDDPAWAAEALAAANDRINAAVVESEALRTRVRALEAVVSEEVVKAIQVLLSDRVNAATPERARAYATLRAAISKMPFAATAPKGRRTMSDVTKADREQALAMFGGSMGHLKAVSRAAELFARVRELEAELAEARRYAVHLLATVVPTVEPAESVAAMLSQIDAWSAGLRLENAALRPLPSLTEARWLSRLFNDHAGNDDRRRAVNEFLKRVILAATAPKGES